MALCHKLCPDCPMTTTVLVEGSDTSKNTSKTNLIQFFKEHLLAFYDNVISDKDNDVADLAIILRIDGFDVGVRCMHYCADISLF
jgi:hypothetical protein